MVSKKIVIKNENELLKFVRIVKQYPYFVGVSMEPCTMDAKSILGMLGLGFNRVMRMDIYSEKADDLLEAVGRFIKT